MILHRISKAIRRQDWFTVLIEICIVVIGLLIGLQINNWNETRADRVKESAFIERLAADVDRTSSQLSLFITGREERLSKIAMVERMYFGDAEVTALSEVDCSLFAYMHVISQPPVAVPSITEAFAAGKIDLISDSKLIQALIVLQQNEDRLRTVIDYMASISADLSEKHPKAISWVTATESFKEEWHKSFDRKVFESSGFRMSAQCHFLDAPPGKTFLSDMVKGYQNNQHYVNFLKSHLKLLDELAAVLEGKLISYQSEIQ